MTELEKIRELKNLSDLAIYLGYTAKGLSYILYKDENKYHHFDIPKKKTGKSGKLVHRIRVLKMFKKDWQTNYLFAKKNL